MIPTMSTAGQTRSLRLPCPHKPHTPHNKASREDASTASIAAMRQGSLALRWGLRQDFRLSIRKRVEIDNEAQVRAAQPAQVEGAMTFLAAAADLETSPTPKQLPRR